MTKNRVINSHRMQQKGRRPHQPAPANVQKTLAYYRGMFLEAVDKLLVVRDSRRRLVSLVQARRDRDRLLTAQLAGVCNALADALGLQPEQIDPNRLAEYVKQLHTALKDCNVYMQEYKAASVAANEELARRGKGDAK